MRVLSSSLGSWEIYCLGNEGRESEEEKEKRAERQGEEEEGNGGERKKEKGRVRKKSAPCDGWALERHAEESAGVGTDPALTGDRVVTPLPFLHTLVHEGIPS